MRRATIYGIGSVLSLLLVVVSLRADELTTTRPHRFWVTNRDANGDGVLGDWIEADDLRVGDRFLLADGSEAVLHASESTHGGIESEGIHLNFQPSTFNFQPVTTYNFEVADTHTYFAAKAGVWVHNASVTPCFDPSNPDALIPPGGRRTVAFFNKAYPKSEMHAPIAHAVTAQPDDYLIHLSSQREPTWGALADMIPGASPTGLEENPFLMLQGLPRVNPKRPSILLPPREIGNIEAASRMVRVIFEIEPSDRLIYTATHAGFVDPYVELLPIGTLIGSMRKNAIVLAPKGVLYRELRAIHTVMVSEEGVGRVLVWRPGMGYLPEDPL